MAELHVQRKRHNYTWLWFILILIVIAAAVYLYLHSKNPKDYPLPEKANHSAMVLNKNHAGTIYS